jgi:hypothetical protein
MAERRGEARPHLGGDAALDALQAGGAGAMDARRKAARRVPPAARAWRWTEGA